MILVNWSTYLLFPINESISQGALDGLCAQMQCKGVLILGEIIEGDEDESTFILSFCHFVGD
jgi:hypothetical protein